ncbi:MAG TPA: hypothetical protein VGJ60_12245 [Chloroflexota bacterium]|jgi:hypothetical protein
MAEPSPALVKFVRRALRRDATLTYEQILELWSAAPGGHSDDADAVREVYDEERAIADARTRREPDPGHSRKVLITVAIWVGAHLVILAALDVPMYAGCSGSSECGLGLALTAFAIGWIQLIYGVVTGAVLSRSRPAIAQGVFIGTATVTIGFTFLCFGLLGVR